MQKRRISKFKIILFLLTSVFIPTIFVSALDEPGYFCSVFTEEGKITHRICDDSGSVTFKAHYPENLKIKNFSWNCQAEEITGGLNDGLEDSGRLKIFSTPNKIGYLTMFSQQGRLFYFWVERGEEKFVPCGKANWFTCKNSESFFWFASSEQNGSQFKAKKIKDLKDYPFEGIYTVSTEKKFFILWHGNDEWNTFSTPGQLNVGQLDLNDLSFKIKSEENKNGLNKIIDLEASQTLMAEKNILTKEEIDLGWKKITGDPVTLELPQESFKLEALNDSAGEMALFLELKKNDEADEENSTEIIDEKENISSDNGKEKTCFYDKPGVYRPSLSIEYEDGKKTACAPMPLIEVSDNLGCRVRVKKVDSKDRFADKLKIYLGEGIEARIEGECLEEFEPKWSIYGANPDEKSQFLNERNIKLFPEEGADPFVSAEMENKETGESLECKEANITAREKMRWR